MSIHFTRLCGRASVVATLIPVASAAQVDLGVGRIAVGDDFGAVEGMDQFVNAGGGPNALVVGAQFELRSQTGDLL